MFQSRPIRRFAVLASLLLLSVWGATPAQAVQTFRRGDTNADGVVDITDGVTTLDFLFLGADSPGTAERYYTRISDWRVGHRWRPERCSTRQSSLGPR